MLVEGQGDTSSPEAAEDGRVVTVLRHMGATDPADKISSRAIKVEKGSGSLGHS